MLAVSEAFEAVPTKPAFSASSGLRRELAGTAELSPEKIAKSGREILGVFCVLYLMKAPFQWPAYRAAWAVPRWEGGPR